MSSVTEKIWQDYHGQLRRFIQRRMHDQSDVDDLLHEVFVKIHTNLDSLRDEDKLRSWLFQITRNAIADSLRRRKPFETLPEWLVATNNEPAELAARELAECLRPMIEQLPEHYRSALISSELEGKTQRQVAGMHGLSLSGAKSRVQRGRALLKGMLLECCRIDFDHRGQIVDYDMSDPSCKGC